jgi:O-antigen ligase
MRALAVVAAGVLIAFTGGSRATIGLFAIGLVFTWILSVWHQPSGRKSAIGFGMVVALVLAAPVLWSAVERRSGAERADSNKMRSQMIHAAKMIISDYPMGVGPNRYVVVANTGGYAARAGIAWNPANREAPVHNSYYLVTAEMGWLGLLGLVTLLGSIIGVGVSAMRKASRGLEAELLVGATASMIIFAIHAYFEWITMFYHIHYLAGISVGLIVGLRALSMRKAEMIKLRTAPARSELALQ